MVGTIDRLKQDPKAYPRTPQDADKAELGTAIIRYALDSENWNAKSPEVALDCSIEGLSGISIRLEEKQRAAPGEAQRSGDRDDNGNSPLGAPSYKDDTTQGGVGGGGSTTPGKPPQPNEAGQKDYEVSFDVIETDSFFYDPRSYRADFSDARYMGEAKWLDLETAQELFPDHAEDLASSVEDSSYLSTNPDRETKFFAFDGGKHLIRLVDIWYMYKGKWCWTMFTGSMILDSGESYLFDEKGRTMCRYIMFACNVDHDGDRYGFVRNMKSAQDEYNARRSRALFTANSRRLIMAQGTVADVERARTEWARPDGVVVTNSRTPDEGVRADDQQFDFAGQMKLMENAVAELENYGPSQALVGDMPNQSGRAIQLLQQSAIAELGPYILGYKGWKIRVYRALFNAVQRYWTAERWIRITDSQQVLQFIQLNAQQKDQFGNPMINPMTGQPIMQNMVGELDVDIIMDEGQDTINAQQDVYETLSQIMPSIAPMLKPAEASAAVSILIDSSSLSASAKKTWRDATQQQPDPMQQQAKQIALQGEAAKVGETQSKTQLNFAKAQQAWQPAGEDPSQLPPQIHLAKAVADITETHATAAHKQALANEANANAALAPHIVAHDARMQRAELGLDAHMQAAKLGLDAHNAEQDRRNRLEAVRKRSNGNGQA